MKIATSILSEENKKYAIEKLNTTNSDYIHLDVMDKIFVPNKTLNINEIKKIIKGNKKPLDIHLMVEDQKKYIEKYLNLNPEIISIHLETDQDLKSNINLIKSNNVKCGIAINPETEAKKIKPFIDKINLILVMSVTPGYGAQKFINTTYDKIIEIKKIIKDKKILIEVDGGINNKISKKLKENGVDIIVSGSYITNSRNYQEQINKLSN